MITLSSAEHVEDDNKQLQNLQFHSLLPPLEQCSYPDVDEVEQQPSIVDDNLQSSINNNSGGPSDDKIASLHQEVHYGNAAAASTLGRYYYEGVHVPKNIPLAIRLFHFSADAGDSDAQAILGVLLLRGTELRRNDSLSVYWFTRASSQRHPRAEFFLAMAHLTGTGVVRSLGRAQDLLKRSALNGNVDSLLFLKNNPRLFPTSTTTIV